MKELGIYIHIPFCVKKCKYCDFNSYSGMESYQIDYIKSLVKEINNEKDNFAEYIVTTLFIGGGTPSCLFQGAISTILSEIKKCFKLSDDVEISIESNPNSINYTNALEWYMAGVNRVSVGLQTSKNSLLSKIGRSHNKQDYINAMNTLKSVGFTNINTDLMLGLPGQKMSDLKKSINLAHSLGSKHISLYSLILEEKTQLYNEVKQGLVKLPSEKKVVGMMISSNSLIKKLGYNRYEVSNYSKQGYQCKHNCNCWNMVEYVGFGAGAHSFANLKRWNNVLSITKYISNISKNKTVRENVDSISKKDLYEEYIMLGLRLVDGISLLKLKELTNIDIKTKKQKEISILKNMKLIDLYDDILKATDMGMMFLNKIIEMLI